MFRNKCLPSALRVPIKDHASEVHETLYGLTGKRFRLNARWTSRLRIAPSSVTELWTRPYASVTSWKRPVAPPTAHNGFATPSAQSRQTAPIRRILRLATPPPPPVRTAVKNIPAAEETLNGLPSPAWIVTPARTPDGLDEIDSKYPLLYSMLRNMIATHRCFRHEH